MAQFKAWMLDSEQGGKRYTCEWGLDKAAWVALLAHGYGEHIGRYGHVAKALNGAGATVLGIDHAGHGKSEGERALIADFGSVIKDLHQLAVYAQKEYPGLPVVLIGHSMGGMIAAFFAQQFGSELKALVLSGPMFGAREGLEMLLSMDPIPEIPLDPGTLSRDPVVGQTYADDPLVWHGPFKKGTLQAMMACMDKVLAGPSLGDLPFVWMHGEADQLVPLEPTRPVIEHLQGSRSETKIYTGAMHEIFNETNQKEVLQDVIGFVRRALA